MNVAFRTDATSQIGSGHFVRCLALADQLQSQGAKISFISRDLPQYLCDILKDRGMEHLPLDCDSLTYLPDDLSHSLWLRSTQMHDALSTKKLLLGKTWDWLVVDHYALDARWEKSLRSSVMHLMVIDDIADRYHDCDVLLDQNFYSDMSVRYSGKVPEGCRLLLGPRYALLREDFRKFRNQIKQRSGNVKKILLFFGGVDEKNYTGVAIEALAKLDVSNISVEVVVGAVHPFLSEIKQACLSHGFIFHVQTDRMAELMADADLALGAGGSATWERCFMGLPTLCIFTADNQRKQVKDAALAGLLCAPFNESFEVCGLSRHIKCLLENAPLREMISKLGMTSVDGNGVLRVAAQILRNSNEGDVSSISIRRACSDDASLAWIWRNSEVTRKFFFDSSAVSLEDHCTWWNRSLDDSRRELLIGCFNEKPCGVIRFDFNTLQAATVSIYLDPLLTGQGKGRELLQIGLDWLRENHPNIEAVVAEVIPENSASLRMFLSADFHEQHKVLVKKV